ncbi:hypothetical protein QFC24_000709 [Naganishia onofrii]|uniref:Uncharacterized protein n=1 Tax=Naganishia onofrii TaxID=1851511 RepID=A0ACC2XVL2_9TREE|nr:hypothetical protein QFC24_000709 [Naganishia onofrii]
MPPRASLASATAAFHAICSPLLDSAATTNQPPEHTLFTSLDQLEHLLDLFAHVERIDDKLIRSARKVILDGSLTPEQYSVVEKYTRPGEMRKKRRMYLNSLLSSAINRHSSINRNRTAILSLSLTEIPEFDALFPLYDEGDEGYKKAKHLFVRNVEDTEGRYVSRTLDKYRDVMDVWNRGDGWQPSLLPNAKPLSEIIKGMQLFVQFVTRAQKDLQKVGASLGLETHILPESSIPLPIPTSKERSTRSEPGRIREETPVASSSSTTRSQREREISVIPAGELEHEGRQRQRSASLRPSMDQFLRTNVHERGSSRAPSVGPSRAASVVRSSLARPPPPPPATSRSNSTVDKGKQRARQSLPARLAPVYSPGSINTDLDNTTRSSTSLRLPNWEGEEEGHIPDQRKMSNASRAILQFFGGLGDGEGDATDEEGNDEVGKRSESGGSVRQGRAGGVMMHGVQVDPRTPPPQAGMDPHQQPSTRSNAPAAETGADQMSRNAASLPQAAAAETVATPVGQEVQAVRERVILHPSPGMKFEMDAQGKLVYVGGGAVPSDSVATTIPLATTPSVIGATTTSERRAFNTPESLAASREKVARAAEATRSPVPNAIIRSRVSLGGADTRRADACGREGFAMPDAPRDKGKRRHSESVRPIEDDIEIIDVEEGRKRQRVSQSPVARSVDTSPSAARLVTSGAQTTTTATPTNERPQSERRSSRPAPFEDFEIERLPSTRRVRRSSGTAVAFSRAIRDAHGGGSAEGSGRR